jgi:hypothetical protein
MKEALHPSRGGVELSTSKVAGLAPGYGVNQSL